ncbi:hypothetical protein BV898_18369 [Hypsibius exemplaris]|uniref:G-protein coupled receptors family 1 profile domain-containing protein n=1 Tax=Hypsibius exemplaris TaxID=2072580 RepID=A0A9X6RNE3_HYPEX|nr:hypothetical protein BV898_18369 [Hypsibius exemplaris]
MNDTNLTAASPSFPLLSPAKEKELTALTAIALAISGIGVINNALTLRVTWSNRLGKTGVSLLLFHFVAINLLECLVTMPTAFTIMLAKRAGHLIPEQTCPCFTTLYMINVSVVNWSDADLALNRFIALYFPHRYKALTSAAVNRAVIVGTWMISVGISLPFGLSVWGQGTFLSAFGHCSLKATGSRGAFLQAMVAYIPYAISGTGSLLILWKCFGISRFRARNVASNHSGNNAVARYRTTERRLNMAKMLLFTFLWSGICAFPAYLITSLFGYLYQTNPVSVMWTRTSSACQYAFAPVR